MIVKHMEPQDRAFVMGLDPHMTENGYRNHVGTKTGYILWEDGAPVGMMHYTVLWDQLPFLNVVFVEEPYRNRGFASQALAFWEADMKRKGYPMVLLSTRADESSQHLYRKLGYVDCGGLVLHHTPLDQPMELFFRKVL